ncbi:MAG TPA: cytochrome C oxidase subunit IV family protein [Candidatus Saccharimonadales bacterium]|nr:cytochrome C oxidase subunit IV family protein [Candidatus Saccharimonadales bacterium]
MKKYRAIVSIHDHSQASYRAYVSGFVLSLVLTLSAYMIVTSNRINGGWGIAILISLLALLQFVTQMVLFLHLGKESKPKFKLLVFGFMLTVVLILVGGSVWIMYNLNQRMMSPQAINNYMKSQDGGV